MFEPTVLQDNVIPLNREPMSAERTHIENKIADKRRQVAQLAQEIRWLQMELES
jgi:hypothetical protein